MYQIGVVSLFPELVAPVMEAGVVGRAAERGLVGLEQVSPREFTTDRHRTVDDRPYGGGPGMVMKYEPLREAVHELRRRLPQGCREFVLAAQGRPLDQALVRELATAPGLLLVCGRYEGIDERFVEAVVPAELSLGDYVLSGGELAAAVVIDAVVRLLPGVLGDECSHVEDSFTAGLLDCPQYTRPEVVDGLAVPPVLLGGDHEAIKRWRRQQALCRTARRRPELLANRALSREEREWLELPEAEPAKLNSDG
jgi:tRNA (guanine37-N1)-methyltransferase